MNYYNEHNPKAAAWLRELIAQGHLPPGHVGLLRGYGNAINPQAAAQFIQAALEALEEAQ